MDVWSDFNKPDVIIHWLKMIGAWEHVTLPVSNRATPILNQPSK